jgi:hypothetical protein
MQGYLFTRFVGIALPLERFTAAGIKCNRGAEVVVENGMKVRVFVGLGVPCHGQLPL